MANYTRESKNRVLQQESPKVQAYLQENGLSLTVANVYKYYELTEERVYKNHVRTMYNHLKRIQE